jgi:phosphate transport system ATP-binding protein
MNGGQKVRTEELSAWFRQKQALKNVNLSIKANAVTAIVGPSGCGKSTLIRTLNRMHELVPGSQSFRASASGRKKHLR